MNFIIICFVCVALILAVIFFAKRHMQKVTQAYVEPQTTRRKEFSFVAIMVIAGVVVTLFNSCKQKALEDGALSSQPQQTELSEAEIQKSEFLNLKLYWDYEYALRYYEQKKVLAHEKAKAEYAKYQQALAQTQSQSDKLIYEKKLAKAKAELSSTQIAIKEFKNFALDLDIVFCMQIAIYVLFVLVFALEFLLLRSEDGKEFARVIRVITYFGCLFGIIFILWDAYNVRGYFSIVNTVVLALIICAFILDKKCHKYVYD